MVGKLYGSVKIKDGLFLGDEKSSDNIEMIMKNKITRIINCSAKQIRNKWEPVGVIYLSYQWLDNETQVILDQDGKVVKEFCNFINESLRADESILVFSRKGENRSVTVIAAYLMSMYNWPFTAALAFILSKKPMINLRTNFKIQLMDLEEKLKTQSPKINLEDFNDEQLLKNTFVNEQISKQPYDLSPKTKTMKSENLPSTILDNVVLWKDDLDKEKFVTIIPSKIAVCRLQSKKTLLASIMKGSSYVMNLCKDEAIQNPTKIENLEPLRPTTSSIIAKYFSGNITDMLATKHEFSKKQSTFALKPNQYTNSITQSSTQKQIKKYNFVEAHHQSMQLKNHLDIIKHSQLSNAPAQNNLFFQQSIEKPYLINNLLHKKSLNPTSAVHWVKGHSEHTNFQIISRPNSKMQNKLREKKNNHVSFDLNLHNTSSYELGIKQDDKFVNTNNNRVFTDGSFGNSLSINNNFKRSPPNMYRVKSNSPNIQNQHSSLKITQSIFGKHPTLKTPIKQRWK